MARGMNYVMARTFAKRPTLQHIVTNKGDHETICGANLDNWSRVWMNDKIKVLLCRRCALIAKIRI